MSYETKQQEISKEMQDLNGRLETFTKSKEYSKGYSDCKKEYEEKLRWIPVSEKLPELNKPVQLKMVKSTGGINKYFYSNGFAYTSDITHKTEINDNTHSLGIATHWRYFL